MILCVSPQNPKLEKTHTIQTTLKRPFLCCQDALHFLLPAGHQRGNAFPNTKDIKKILDSVDIEADEGRNNKVISELNGQNVKHLRCHCSRYWQPGQCSQWNCGGLSCPRVHSPCSWFCPSCCRREGIRAIR